MAHQTSQVTPQVNESPMSLGLQGAWEGFVESDGGWFKSLRRVMERKGPSPRKRVGSRGLLVQGGHREHIWGSQAGSPAHTAKEGSGLAVHLEALGPRGVPKREGRARGLAAAGAARRRAASIHGTE